MAGWKRIGGFIPHTRFEDVSWIYLKEWVCQEDAGLVDVRVDR